MGGIRFYSNMLGVVGTLARVSGLDGSAREISLAFSDVDPVTQRLLAETLASDER